MDFCGRGAFLYLAAANVWAAGIFPVGRNMRTNLALSELSHSNLNGVFGDKLCDGLKRFGFLIPKREKASMVNKLFN